MNAEEQDEFYEDVKMEDEYRDLNLTTFQANFCEAYVKTGNGAEAARSAGTESAKPANIAAKTLKLPKVQKAIAILQKKRIEAVALDTTEVLQKLREVYEQAMKMGKFSDANKAAELLGQHLGMFGKGVNASGKKEEGSTLTSTAGDNPDVGQLVERADMLMKILEEPAASDAKH